MDLSRIRNYTHKHCRFKLKNGREVFGVVWEVETTDPSGQGPEEKKLFFASVRDYQRLQRDARQPINVMPLRPDEIVAAENIAS